MGRCLRDSESDRNRLQFSPNSSRAEAFQANRLPASVRIPLGDTGQRKYICLGAPTRVVASKRV
jgi:hypothetical protein